MSLSTRITVTLAVVLAVGALAMDRIQRSVFERSFGSVERADAEEAARTAQRALDDELQELGRDAARIAWSDALHADAAQPAPLAPGALGEPSVLAATGLDVVFITDADGSVRWSHVRHPDRGEDAGLEGFPGSAVNLQQLLGDGLDVPGVADERGVLARGLVVTPGGPLLIAARNLVPATHVAPRRGIVVVGRFLGARLDSALERRLGFDVDVWPVGAADLPADFAAVQDEVTSSPAPLVRNVSDERLDAFASLDDIRRRPEFLLRTTLERKVSATAGIAARSGLLMSLTLALGLLLALLGSLRALVLRPLRDLTRDVVRVGADEDYSVRVARGRDDEIGLLAAEFDRMLERLEAARGQVIETARAAGMSEIAMGILHNVGNVLNSVNISASVLGERVDGLCIDDLRRLSDVLRRHEGDLAKFVTEDPQGKHLQPFLAALVEQLSNDHALMREEVLQLAEGVDHVCELVKSQQGLARSGQVVERVSVERLITDAMRMTERSRGKHNVALQVDIEQDLPLLVVDRNKVLEIVVNLVQNARQAIEEAGEREDGHHIRVRAARTMGGRLCVDVTDTGTGIDAANLTRIFQLGFTTKPKGSGLGLHTAANGARTLGGELRASSAGKGHGSTFSLELPINSTMPESGSPQRDAA